MRAGYHPSFERDTGKQNTLKAQGFYHSRAWRRLRLLALQRDHYLCQECLRQKRFTRATEVHHLKPIVDRPDLALDLDNLESLCWDCHEKTKPRGKPTVVPHGVRVIKVMDGSETDSSASGR